MTNFNLLKDAYSVKNTTTCRYDTLNGYISDFSSNGDVDGWDIYNEVCMYGSWDSILFGTSTAKSCFIGRSNPMNSIPAETYYMLKLTMKITLPDDYGKKIPPTKGKVAWQKASDPVWLDDHSVEFDLDLSNQWFTYVINMGEQKNWIGNINNLRIYPIIDGFDDIKFMIKSISVDSISEHTCLNTQCSYYTQYSHPCPGAGTRSSAKSGVSISNYTTVSGVSDNLILNIDGYGDEHVRLGNNDSLVGTEMAKVLVDRISRVNAGQYAYVEVEYISEEGKLQIYSGAMSDNSTIEVSGSAAKALGFVNDEDEDVYETTQGTASATGFDFGASRRLKGFELNALIDSNVEDSAYYHNPRQYNVEAGRRDFADSMSSTHAANANMIDYYELIEASQSVIIDASHPINDSGRLSKIWLNGDYINKQKTQTGFAPKAYIFRPDKNNNVEVIHELDIELEEEDLRYTIDHVTFRIDCDVLVNKGDLIGFYNIKILAPLSSRTKRVNAVYFKIPCGSEGPPSGKFSLGKPDSQGVVGLSYYARSNRLQSDIQLDIDIGERTNINEVSIYGTEYSEYFEYNIACCLDVDWTVDCHNLTHWHRASSECNVIPTLVYVEHRNKPYGVECLSDCKTTADGGLVGTSYITRSMGPTNSNAGFGSVANTDPSYYSGIETYGEHSYCYVNGDAEWLNGGCNFGGIDSTFRDQAEFKHPWIANVYNFEFDPISYYLIFPNDKELDVHKTVMYFKESQNFKRYSLSYYMGENGPRGNAEEIRFNYVPSYNAVTLDGNRITPEQGEEDTVTESYTEVLFSNPVPWAIPEYHNGVCTNWDIYQTVMNMEFNVLQHDFNSVTCQGFKIHTTWHRSTKLTELELYSKMPVQPTLLDNVRLLSSTYGEFWQEASFTIDEFNSDKIKAHVPSNPRYFRLQLQSQDIFELKEIDAKLSEEYIKDLDCENTLLPDVAPRYTYSEPKKLEIENTYDIPLDLLVDIPRQLFREKYALSWIRFDSENTAINAEIGPGAIIRKADDYPIYLSEGQVAINTPSYYLRNLVDGKASYTYENEHSWAPYKTLAHGEDVNYTNIPNGKVTTMGFLPVSTKFWKLSVHETMSAEITNLKLFHNQESTMTPAAFTYEDFSEFNEGDYLPEDFWQQTFSIRNGYYNLQSDGGWKGDRSKFYLQGDFDIDFKWKYDNCDEWTDRYFNAPELHIRSVADTSREVAMYYGTSGSYQYIWLGRKDLDGVWRDVNSRTDLSAGNTGRWFYFRLKRVGDTFTMYWRTIYDNIGQDDEKYPYDSNRSKSFTYSGGFGNKAYLEFALNAHSVGTGNTISVYISKIRMLNGTAFLDDVSNQFEPQGLVDIDKVYIQAEPREGSGKIETSFDSVNQIFNPATLIEDDFNDGTWYDKWVGGPVLDSDNTFVEKSGAVFPMVTAGSFVYLEKEFPIGPVSYDAEVHFNLDFPTTMVYSIEFINPSNETTFKMNLIGYGNNTAKLIMETYTPPDQLTYQEYRRNETPFAYRHNTFTKSSSEYNDGFVFSCKKVYRHFSYLKLTNTDGTRTFYSGSNLNTNWDRISKIRITYSNDSTKPVTNQFKNYGTSYVRFRALPNFSDHESVVFGFTDSQPIDTIRLVQPSGDISYPIIRISDQDNDDYRIWAKNFSTSGLVSTEHWATWGDEAYSPAGSYSTDSRPSYAFRYSNYSYHDANSEHYLAYDFGAGNTKIIQHVYYKSYYYYYSTSSYRGGRNWKTCRIYGHNEYKVDFIKRNQFPLERIKIDLRGATLLKEFTVNHNSNNTAYNIVDFENDQAFRYIIFHYPEYVDQYRSSTYNFHVEQIKFYEKFTEVPASAITLSNNNYENYLAIDLGQIHNLDFLRNYGPKSNLLELFHTQDNLDYSNSNTSNIDEVNWYDEIPALLFNFSTRFDSVDIDRAVYKTGNVEFFTSNGPFSGSHVYIGKKYIDLYLGETSGSSSSSSGPQYANATRTWDPVVDASYFSQSTAKLVIELKIGDPANLEGGQVEVSSSTSSNSAEWYYSYYGTDPLDIRGTIDTVYKEFHLPLSYFQESGGGPDLRYLRRIRVYMRSADGYNTISWRNARLVSIYDENYVNTPFREDYYLSDQDFTIDFWVKRHSFTQYEDTEGILGQTAGTVATSSFSFVFDSQDYLSASFYVGNLVYTLKSNFQISRGTDWYHVAVCRSGSFIYLYINGVIQTSVVVGENNLINSCVEDLYFGKSEGYSAGVYLDEFRLLLGKAEWESNFTPPSSSYNISGQAGNPEEARWVRMTLLCGDGVTRNINKVGIYPNISIPFLPTGGYNCEWLPLNNRLTNYQTIARNLSPSATLLGEELIEETFNDDLNNWENLEYTLSNDIIHYTDFGGDNPNDFWDGIYNGLNNGDSYYDYTAFGLYIYLAAGESGAVGFYAPEIYENCQCEVIFSHDHGAEVSYHYTALRMHTEEGHYYGIRLYRTTDYTEWQSEINGAESDDGNIDLIEGFRLKRNNDRIDMYTLTDGTWTTRETYTNQEHLDGGAVKFEFINWKGSSYPEVGITLESMKITSLSSSSEEVVWEQVESEDGYALACTTSGVLVEQGPILNHPSINTGSKIHYAEFYYYNSGIGGGGISFVDSLGDEVLGIATISPEWVIFSGDGHDVVNLSPESGNDSWYRVRAVFDWDNSSVSVDWEDIDATTTLTYVKTLKKDTDVAQLHVKGTAGINWGSDYLDIKFDNLTISPTVAYMHTFEPSNCLTGDMSLQGYENCWGFPASLDEPTLLIDLGDTYSVDRFVMHSRPSSDNYDHIVNDFDIYGATSISGTFDLLVSETGFTESFNSAGQNVYSLEQPVQVSIIKLVVKSYSKPSEPPVYFVGSREEGTEVIIDGGFIREFEIWSCTDSVPVNSEDHPIVCTDLKDQFNLTYHSIEGPNYVVDDGEKKDWSNENKFFQFSSDATANPNQVAFSGNYDFTVSFSYTDEFLIDGGAMGTFTIDTDVFFAAGQYQVQWYTYAAQEEEGISLILTGKESQEMPCKYTGTGWNQQNDTFKLEESGYYHVQIKSIMEGGEGSEVWGVRNIYIKSFNSTSKWVALRRNTAENFVWDTSSYDEDDDNETGVDYLQYLKVYSEDDHRPTEYYWFWESFLSTLSNEGVNIKVGKRALRIDYPASNYVDYVKFLEGDCFGHDKDWSIKDALSFWLYIEDIDKLYIEEGGFVFGSEYGYSVVHKEELVDDDYDDTGYNPSAPQSLYIWKFKDLDLKTGWNQVRLRFDNHLETIPDALIHSDRLPEELNLKEHVTSSFSMVYGGKGEAFYMLLDDLHIERNWFFDEVAYGDHGLCLTWSDFAEIPLTGLDTRYGTVETWVKLYTDTTGRDIFNDVKSRTLFTIVDTDNNSISLSIRSSSWFELGVGNTKSEYKTAFIDPKEHSVAEAAFDIDDVLHIALTWSNDSSKIEGNDTIRLYVNGKLYLKGMMTWNSGDNKNVVLRLGGGNTYLANNDDMDGSAIFSNIKFYNYCKTEFNINQQAPTDIRNLTPNDFVQVSEDNIEFFNGRDEEMPLEFKQVQPGEKVPVYIRVDKSKMDELDRLTGSINVEWKVPV